MCKLKELFTSIFNKYGECRVVLFRAKEADVIETFPTDMTVIRDYGNIEVVEFKYSSIINTLTVLIKENIDEKERTEEEKQEIC